MKQILVRHTHCTGCKSCELACSIAHSEQRSLFGAILAGETPVRRIAVETNADHSLTMPLQCRQCAEPMCVSACMTGAMWIDEKTGIVHTQPDKCVACFMCVMLCPYGAIKEAKAAKKTVKCDQCASVGNPPACVSACPTKALSLTEVNDFTAGTRQAFLTQFVGKEG